MLPNTFGLSRISSQTRIPGLQNMHHLSTIECKTEVTHTHKQKIENIGFARKKKESGTTSYMLLKDEGIIPAVEFTTISVFVTLQWVRETAPDPNEEHTHARTCADMKWYADRMVLDLCSTRMYFSVFAPISESEICCLFMFYVFVRFIDADWRW